MRIFASIIVLAFLASCATTNKFSMDVIMFDKTTYSPTAPSTINIYKSRLEIPNKYYEIGTIKFQGEAVDSKIKESASKLGAEALILDGNNYILIKFKEKEKETPDETKTI